MKFIIKHETKGRMRIHAVQNRMSYAQADTLLYFLHSRKEVTFAKVYDSGMAWNWRIHAAVFGCVLALWRQGKD